MTIKRFLTLFSTFALLAGWFSVAPHGQRRPTVSADLAHHAAGPHRHRVIVQADEGALSTLRGRRLGVLRRQLSGAVALDVSDAELDALTRDGNVLHVSGDLPVHADMAVTNKVTNAATVWQGTSGLLGLGGTPGYKGSGITVAVLDSGIASHQALGTRVVARVSFVSTEPTVAGDPFGHGTHVAGIVGGNGGPAASIGAPYSGGSAPSVKLVDVRVLGSNGSGLTSDVIAGINWVVQNRKLYGGIRIINLSLGHPVTESSVSDPLDKAVATAVANGIVVVAAAGNYGQTSTGATILGGVTSPGNSPFAITVGAIDTKGTADTSDDKLAPYSSRGPTKYDFGVKPDVVAPGTRIVSLEVAGSYLSTTYPSWHVAGSASNAYARMTGTSMAAAVVSGGVALLLNAQPTLSPAQVKIALQMGARYVSDAGLIGAGTGGVDFAASLRVANQGLIGSLLTSITNLLGLSSGAAFRDAGTLIDRVYDRSGIRLLRLLDLSALFDAAESAEWGVLNLLGLTNPLASKPANYLVWGQVAGWTSSYYVVWGSTIQDPSGQYVVWGSSDVTDGSYVVWGSSLPGSDGSTR